MLFGKNNIKFGQKCFASPKLGTPVHLCQNLFWVRAKRASTQCNSL